MLIDQTNEAQTEALAGEYQELLKSGLAPHPQSPAGAALLRAYKAHQANQQNRGTVAAMTAASIVIQANRDEVRQARKKMAKRAAKQLKKARRAAALAGPALEERALRRGEKRMRSAVDSGMSTPKALDAGFDAYREDGGRLTIAGWKRKMTDHLK